MDLPSESREKSSKNSQCAGPNICTNLPSLPAKCTSPLTTAPVAFRATRLPDRGQAAVGIRVIAIACKTLQPSQWQADRKARPEIVSNHPSHPSEVTRPACTVALPCEIIVFPPQSASRRCCAGLECLVRLVRPAGTTLRMHGHCF